MTFLLILEVVSFLLFFPSLFLSFSSPKLMGILLCSVIMVFACGLVATA